MTVNEIIPFLAVKDLAKSLDFYVRGLGFSIRDQWIDEGVPRWCRLQLGQAGLMLQQFKTDGPDARHFSANKGEGVTLCIFCADAIAVYERLNSHGFATSEPSVGNGLWVTSVTDPDGYRLDFQSPTDVPEDTKLSEAKARSAL